VNLILFIIMCTIFMCFNMLFLNMIVLSLLSVKLSQGIIDARLASCGLHELRHEGRNSHNLHTQLMLEPMAGAPDTVGCKPITLLASESSISECHLVVPASCHVAVPACSKQLWISVRFARGK
jgi:hypothetical protein